MKSDLDIFREEDLIINHMEEVGRLDQERELGRLLNVLNDILIQHSNFTPHEVEGVYTDIKNEMRREYLKTVVSELSPIEMRIWHVSMFSCVEYLEKLMLYKGVESPEELESEFEDLLRTQYQKRLKQLSEEHDVSDLSERLPHPEIVLSEENMEFLYWIPKNEQQQQVTSQSTHTNWMPEREQSGEKSEVKI